MSVCNVFLVRNVGGNKYGGGEVYQLQLAKELMKYGFSPIIITNSRILLENAKNNGINVLVPPFSKRQDWSGWKNILLPFYYLFQKRLASWYKKVIRIYNPITINIQSRDDMIAGTKMASKYGVPVLWTDHADFKNWVLWNINVKYKNLIGKRIIKMSGKTDKVIFVSEEVARETCEMIKPMVLQNASVICNGIEDEKDKYDGTQTVKDSFAFVGRVVKEKGVEELLEAFSKVRCSYPNIELNIYGEGEIEKIKSSRFDCKKIKFHGFIDDPLGAIAKNEFFIFPSYQEGLSLSLLEAAMMGKKIIASDVGGNLEVVVNSQTGLLVPPKNIDKLAEAMIWMLEHKKESNKMAKNVRKRYEDKFNFEKIFKEKMLPLYNINKEEK